MTVSVQTEDFDPQAVVDQLCAGRADIGAVVTFVGLVRDSAKAEKISAMQSQRAEPAEPAEPADEALLAHLEMIENLSDEEVARMLAELQDSEGAR